MGVLLVIVGLIVMLFVHWTVGLILLVAGFVLLVAAAAGHSRYW